MQEIAAQYTIMNFISTNNKMQISKVQQSSNCKTVFNERAKKKQKKTKT